MKLNNAFISRIAAAAMAASMAFPAVAQDTNDNLPPDNVTQDTGYVTPATSSAPGLSSAPVTSHWRVQADPHLPLPLIGTMGGAYALLCLYGAGRRFRGSWLRAAAGAAVITTLVNPELQREDRAPLATEVVVVVDRSASQTLGDRGAATDAAYNELSRRLGQMDGVSVRTIEIGRAGGGMADGTSLFGDLAAGLSDLAPERLGGVVLITDGQIHDMADHVKLPLGGAPAHVLLTGADGEQDRRLVLERAPTYGITGTDQEISFRVENDGGAGNDPVAVVVTADDGTVLGRQAVIPGQSATMMVKLPQAGDNVIMLEAGELPGELSAVNNRAAATIRGVQGNMRVLLLTGAPHQGERAWRDLLKSNPAVELIHFSMLRTPDIQDSTPLREMAVIAFPMREIFEQKIDDFDLVIFDHYHADGTIPFVYMERLADYVEKGGAMMVVAGPDYAGPLSLYKTPLARVLPAAPTGQVAERAFRPVISDDGARHPVTRGLDGSTAGQTPQWGQWYRLIGAQPANGATALMEDGQSNPLMLLKRQGAGRVGMMMSDNAWLWARGHDGGGPYADMMARMSFWLMRDRTLEEEALRLSVESGQITVTRQSMADDVAAATLVDPWGATQNVTLAPMGPGQWGATLSAERQGVYSVTQGDLAARAYAGAANPREFSDLRATAALVQPWVEAHGGKVVRLQDAQGNVTVPRLNAIKDAQSDTAMAGTDWLGLRMTAVSEVQGMDRYAPLSGWVAFTLVVGLLAGAWLREGDPAATRRLLGGLWKKKDGPKSVDDAMPRRNQNGPGL